MVSPFLAKYDAQEDVQICSGATAYTNENDKTIVLIFGQGLWFGERMEKLIINPNQCRSYNISVCDDPTDPHRALGISLPDNEIPLTMQGSTAMLLTRCPTREEMDTCRKVFCSDPEFWDPTNVTFPDNGRNIASLRGTVNPNSHSHLYTYEYDIAMASMAAGHCSQPMLRRLIENVNIQNLPNDTVIAPAGNPTLNEYGNGTLTKDRHHAVTPELIARKWGCGLNTAKNTLKATTQLGVRSAIGPLTRRYRTDLLQLHYRRLNTTFFTDTFFHERKIIEWQHLCTNLYRWKRVHTGGPYDIKEARRQDIVKVNGECRYTK